MKSVPDKFDDTVSWINDRSFLLVHICLWIGIVYGIFNVTDQESKVLFYMFYVSPVVISSIVAWFCLDD